MTGDGFEVPITLLITDGRTVKTNQELRTELFGPAAIVAGLKDPEDLRSTLSALDGSLTGTIHGGVDDPWTGVALGMLRRRVGRLIFGGVPTGVAVDRAMMHGGPYPASTSPRDTSVGASAISRFLRPVTYQDFPDALLPGPVRGATEPEPSAAT